MFVGHFALGFGAKRVAPTVSLGTLFLAVQWADLVWPLFVLAGIEKVTIEPGVTRLSPFNFIFYPYSHSLIALILWGLLIGMAYAYLRSSRLRNAWILVALVVSHWVLDVVTHRPDVPIDLLNSVRVGLGLWNSPAGTLIVELSMFVVGVILYARSTIARDRIGRYGFWALVAFLLIFYLASLFGPPPPSVPALAWGAEALWLIILWGYWLDRHRQPRAVSET